MLQTYIDAHTKHGVFRCKLSYQSSNLKERNQQARKFQDCVLSEYLRAGITGAHYRALNCQGRLLRGSSEGEKGSRRVNQFRSHFQMITLGAGEIAQWLKWLQCRHVGQGLDSQNQHKCWMGKAWKSEMRIPRARYLARLAIYEGSGFD